MIKYIKVRYYVVRMLAHVAKNHPNDIKGFHTQDQLKERIAECEGCARWMPREYGGKL